ncbi:acyl-CoA-binding protein [Paenimyroides viscosum]|jgi:diazepam-binding inhibitor (GABA receptor modulating acyl-CoA-binding protein)|uniref:Phosphatidylserine decarboxylase n=1 Tax=Paenimyroides viscosum TaxID=2488729 RepID=A0A3P1B598_9FLAO|nr:acyl-CoA-binding protein [Paenimyroides viscosum]RRA96191.1 phosphatidylserine decarboxylase [Paenimyroides viscosum]
MSQNTDQLFKEAFEKASETIIKLPPDIRLRLYAYYKQATLNYSHDFVYKEVDLIRGFKFNAWKQVTHLTQEEAKILYIDLVKSLKL